jgi:hypothetical protein
MRRIEKWFKGLFKKEKEVFISRFFDHIEIYESTVLFGHFILKEETREVFLPDLKITERGKLRVITEAYTELNEITRRLKSSDKV